MNKIKNIFFSMTTMGVLLSVFAIMLAAATFIENDFGTDAAKALIYNATWFNILLFLLAVNLIANTFIYKMYKLEKLPLLIFHLAFVVILIGAAITRFISFEGMMHLREGETGNTILSDKTYIEINAGDKNKSKAVLLSVLTPGNYADNVVVQGKTIHFKAIDFIPNARQIITGSDEGSPYISVVTSDGTGRYNMLLKEGESQQLGNYNIRFGGRYDSSAVNIVKLGNDLIITAPDTIFSTPMSGDGKSEKFPPYQNGQFVKRKLFSVGNLSLVLTDFYKHGKISYVPYENKNANFMDVAVIEVKSGNETKIVNLRGGKGYKGDISEFSINGIPVAMSFGSKEIKLPFSIKLLDFQLERYPGSMSPASYASEVILTDKTANTSFRYRIYMNHVLDYKGYRFFQSSYDTDEKGSVLSVNHDYWGTFFTYAGYLLMTLGMALALFTGKTRFSKLGKLLKQKHVASVTAILLFSSLPVFTQAQHQNVSSGSAPVIDKTQAEAFGELMVQSSDGRLKPVNTLASEVLRKVTRKSSFRGLTPDQVFLGMLADPVYWQTVPMIKISNKEVAKVLGIKGKYASYLDFIDMREGTYKLSGFVKTVYAKKPSKRGMFDKEIMKVDERLNICYLIYTGKILNVVPNPQDPSARWFNLTDTPEGLSYEDSLMVTSIIPQYLNSIRNGDYKTASELLNGLKNYQKKFGAAIMPPEKKIKAEILYNKLLIFDRLAMIYGILGFVMILLLFIQIFKGGKFINITVKILLWIIIAGFLLQTSGLGLRWYISGHAPWSDGYESMIYIGWVTMLAGLLFSKRSLMTVAATTILTSIILMVAHLSWMDPEITNLVPVLKSYWLTIHVSVITASYGFLALGMLLGFINLVLMILTGEKNIAKMNRRINELTAINERTLIAGLYMLTIGTFLGGVWANESWGRYWGWDPKETWALISVLVYTFIVHMRFIPGLKSRFAFNLASLTGYFSILMTFFGVNYYLSGLHSYAKGDPAPIPQFVYYTIGIIIAVAIAAYNKEQKYNMNNE